MTPPWGPVEARDFLARKRPDLRFSGAERLAGGYWNDVLRLDTDQGQMVLKHYRAVMPGSLFPNLPADEAKALDQLAGRQVAPDLAGFWPQEGVLLYFYVEGTRWDGNLDSLAALLRRKSGVDPTGFREVPITPAEILAEGDALLAACAPDDMARQLASCRPAPAPAPREGWCGKRQLCHTDIGATNLIGAGAALRLIDWQCPAAGDGAEDAYTAISPAFQILNMRAPLGDAERARFVSLLDDPGMSRRYFLLEPAYAWRMACYCLRRLQSAETAEVRARYQSAAVAEAGLIMAATPC